MKIKIVAVGKIKEKWYSDALAEYVKRLGRRVELFEVDEGDVRDSGEATVRQALKKEAEQILPKLEGYAVALDIEGRQLSSEQIAALIEKEKMTSSVFTFVIGSSYGLDESVKGAVRLRLSFGKITLPHTLARVTLAEQLYRAFMINSNSVYHK